MSWQDKVKARKKVIKTPPSANGNGKHERLPATISAQAAAEDPAVKSPFPDPPAEEAYHGILKELVDEIDPHTEASRVALLTQALAVFGNIIGRAPHFRVEATRHYLNLFCCMVGQTAKGRKGTSWDRVRDIFANIDPAWNKNRILGGLSSGEGLIWEVRDPIVKVEPVKENGRVAASQEVEVDKGIEDKRLFIQESEFASVLKQADRQGNTLSPILRQAWESGDLRALSKNSPCRATNAHISIVGHITADELRRYMSSTEAASGFGNRYLWIAVQRSKLLPDGGGACDLEPVKKKFADAVSFAKCVGTMPRDDEARELWHEAYPRLSCDRAGLLGFLLGRSEAQTMRLACLYALLDLSCQVEARHLNAALALWDYCERSTAFIFGQSTGDKIADTILIALRKSPDGLTRTQISSLFSHNESKEGVQNALKILADLGLADAETSQSKGRPLEIWRYRGTKKTK